MNKLKKSCKFSMFQDNVLVNLFRGNESVFPSLSNPHTKLNSTNYFVGVPNLYNQTFVLHVPRGEGGGGGGEAYFLYWPIREGSS